MLDDPYEGMPPHVTKNNLPDGRSMKRNGRVHQLNTKFSRSEIERIKVEAGRRGVPMNSLLVDALEAFCAAQKGEH